MPQYRYSDACVLAEAISTGDRRALARAITLVESTRPDHRQMAEALFEQLQPPDAHSIRVGVSGVPGVGKSTFIEALGLHVIEHGQRVAILAIDPSSTLSGGSILGDKTRMQQLSVRSEAFIRPSPTGGTLGGVTRRTRETIRLCEAAGFGLVLVETVGVGQSETAVADMTDMFVLLLLPSAGDELQGIKRGIVELADLVLVNKADGELEAAAQRAAADYANALRLLRPRSSSWEVPVRTCSAISGAGIDRAWTTIEHYRDVQSANGELAAKRAAQAHTWLSSEIADTLTETLRNHPGIRDNIARLEADVSSGRLPASTAARKLLAIFMESNGTRGTKASS